MEKIQLFSFGKINLSIDVKGVKESGMHEVDMLMQQIAFHDDVSIGYEPIESCQKGEVEIQLTTNRYYLPVDRRNTAYKAAELMVQRFGENRSGRISIDVYKRIPVAAGMAGGSGNGAAVLHGLNVLWNLRLSLKELCNLGKEIGSDVPFCIMGQAAGNPALPRNLRRDRYAASCARATGTGTKLQPVQGLKTFLVIAKPKIYISTGQVYQGIDHCVISERPNNHRLMSKLKGQRLKHMERDFINVLEEYTLKAYPEVGTLKEVMKGMPSIKFALMSGSGPTVFGICSSLAQAKEASNELRGKGYEAYWTRTTV